MIDSVAKRHAAAAARFELVMTSAVDVLESERFRANRPRKSDGWGGVGEPDQYLARLSSGRLWHKLKLDSRARCGDPKCK
jgi:hypothetical protein